MNNIYDLLDFRFPNTLFSDKETNVIPKYIVNLCQLRISKLNDISAKLGNSLIGEMPAKGIKEVYVKFINLCQEYSDFADAFDKREIRTLTYALNYKEYNELSIFENQHYLKQFFVLLFKNWRDSYISGLLNCFLTNWGSANKASFDLLSEFLTNRINSYDGSRTLYRSLKLNSKFFEKDKGDIDLGFTLAILRKPIQEATTHLSLPESWITFPYFVGVINAYVEKSKNRLEEVLEDIAKVLELHSNSTKGTNTNKIIVSKIICYAVYSHETVQDKVKDIAFRLVGDPNITSIWRPYEGANQSEINTIDKARVILNEWITRQFINVFFEKCINDRRRKRFWLQYSKQISAFKVFGPNHIKRLLKQDQRIAEYVDARFHSVESYGDASAFMFLLGDYKMIEFSVPGYAFYAYKVTNLSTPSLDIKKVSSLSIFIDSRMPPLIRNTVYSFHDYSYEGKLSHADSTYTWEEKFKEWLEKIAGIYV